MTARRILTFPSTKLYKKSKPVTRFDKALQALVQDLVDSMEVNNGAGIAAPQIGKHKRVVVLKREAFLDEVGDPLVFVNPELEISGDERVWVESCLSVPLVSARVKRGEKVSIKFQDVEGNRHTLDAEWPLSGALQHECDHLDGKLYLHQLSRMKRNMLQKKIFKQLKKDAVEAARKKAELKKELLDIWGDDLPLKKKTSRVKKTKRQKSRRKR